MSDIEEEGEEFSGEQGSGSELGLESDVSKDNSPAQQEDGDKAAAMPDNQPGAKHSSESTARQKRSKLALSVMEKANKKGVIYMSRIPPHLVSVTFITESKKPLKLRHILSQYGEIGRLYLAPEDPSLRKRRKKLQGSSGKMFSEGWIEFTDKAVAKRVAEMLNGNPMGGKRRSAYHYDLWCLKYLPKFKWDHLTEEIAYQNAVREQKMANEISAAKRERDFYMSRVDRAKAEEAKDHRRKRKAEAEGKSEEQAPRPSKHIMRTFGQKAAKSNEADSVGAKSLPQSVLSLVAGQQG